MEANIPKKKKDFTRDERAIPAVVIGGELNGLGVCRSLAEGGMPIYVVDRKRLNSAMWSRHVRPVLVETLHGRALVDSLLHLRAELGRQPVLVITDEPALLAVSEHRKDLEGHYRFQLPPRDTVLMLHDKARFHESALANGWPVPNGAVVRHAADLAGIRSLRPPVIIKPADKRSFHMGHAPRLAVAATHHAALAACRKLLERAGELLVQECIDGPDSHICFCLFYRDRGGATPGMFTGRKLASTPPGTGSTAFCAPAHDVRDVLERTTAAFLEQVDYAGFGGVEYKWDAAARRFVIIEPTVGRTDWQEEIATLAGVNIPLLAYRHECGYSALPSGPGKDRVVWQSSWVERLRFGSAPIPPDSIVVDGYWRRNDPLPALVHYPRDVMAAFGVRLSAWFGRLGRRGAQWLGGHTGAPEWHMTGRDGGMD